MSMIEYRVMRNVPAVDEKGQDCHIAVALIMHENGVCQRVAIDEALIKFAGEGIIADEVKIAAAVPADASIVRKLDHYKARFAQRSN
jgi:hypothetical protein